MMYAHKKAVTYKYMQTLCNNNIKSDKQKTCHCGICAPFAIETPLACEIHCSYIHKRKLSVLTGRFKAFCGQSEEPNINVVCSLKNFVC